MTAKHSDEQVGLVSRFSVSTSADVTIQITERDGNQFIVIQEHRPAQNAKLAQQIIEIPAALFPELKRAVTALEENFGDDQDGSNPTRRAVNFAHQSEQEFARILDFYHIAWHYEPRTFPIERDDQGKVTKSFTPDFYLPDQDIYIELTTLKQPLVTKKNRKVRMLRELYPEINIKVLYASDYQKLLEKFAGSSALTHKRVEDILDMAGLLDESVAPEQSSSGEDQTPENESNE